MAGNKGWQRSVVAKWIERRASRVEEGKGGGGVGRGGWLAARVGLMGRGQPGWLSAAGMVGIGGRVWVNGEEGKIIGKG